MDINYVEKGTGKPIILIHGWGGSSKSLIPLAGVLANNGFRTVTIDLPGFGSSDAPIEALEMKDYVKMLNDLIKRLEIKKPILLGHSFGGKISLFYATKYPSLISKIILINSSGIKPKKTARTRISYALAKTGKIISLIPPFVFIRPAIKYAFYRSIVRERDYYQAKNLKETFRNIISEHIDDKLNKIINPCLLLWGREDVQTPIYQAEKLHKGLINSELDIIDGVGHSLPLIQPQLVAEHIIKFVNS
jgi:pimeloyl-ACP methyl ester carboxylesterase